MNVLELAAAVGTVLPLVVAVVNQPGWPAWGRALATAAVCLVAGTVTAAAQGGLSGKTWFEATLVVFFAAVGTYRAYWQRSGVTTAIENATALNRGGVK